MYHCPLMHLSTLYIYPGRNTGIHCYKYIIHYSTHTCTCRCYLKSTCTCMCTIMKQYSKVLQYSTVFKDTCSINVYYTYVHLLHFITDWYKYMYNQLFLYVYMYMYMYAGSIEGYGILLLKSNSYIV